MLWLWVIWLLPILPVLANAEEVYVRSSDNETCPGDQILCFTLNEYSIKVSQYFTDNTTFLFLAGIHHLTTPLHIENVSDVRFISLENNSESVQVFLGPLVNVTWTNCDGIEISGLVFNLNRNAASQLVLFSALIFEQTVASVSQLAIFGLNTMQLSTTIKAMSSQIRFDSVKVVGVSGLNAAALYAVNSTIDFFGQNIFANNAVRNGGAMLFRDSVGNFFGNISFFNNIAIPRADPRYSSAGIACVNSALSFNGLASFKENRATLTVYSFFGYVTTSGAILAQSGSKVTFGVPSNTTFTDNFAFLGGGALTIIGDSELVMLGAALFQRNSVTFQGGAIYGVDHSRINCSGKNSIKFVNNSAQRWNGGAIYTSTSSVKLDSLYFEGNRAKKLFGGAVSFDDSNVLIKSCIFVRNPSHIQGGAVYAATTTIVFDEQNTFEENTSGSAGGICVYQSSLTFRGDNNFVSNSGIVDSGGLLLLLSNATISGRTTFHGNLGITGGAIHCVLSSLIMTGNTTFIANKAEGTYGGGIHFTNGTLIISGQASFFKNGAITSGSALYIRNSNIIISGNVSISNGLSSKAQYTSLLEGAIGLLNTTMIITATGYLSLTNNTAFEGGAIIARDSEVVVSGCIRCYNNRANSTGGGLIARRSVINLRSTANCSIFQGNSAHDKGGAIYAELNSFVNMTGLQNFIQNSAQYGGALALSHTSKLILSNPLQANFTENKGLAGGGAIYYEDSFSRSQCINITTKEQQALDCFIELTSESDIQLNFVNNTASVAGTVLYGGDIDSCKLYIGGTSRDTCGNRIGGKYIYGYKVVEVFENIPHIVSVKSEPSTRSSEISSDPLHICFCNANRSLQCEDQEIKLVRGEEFTLMAVIVGQSRGIIPSLVRTSLNTSIQISASQRVQPTGKECTPIIYRLSSNLNNTTLILFPDGPCRDIMRSQRQIHISFLPCPDAFILDGTECVCEDRLQKYTTNCSVDNDSIERGSSDKFWMGAIYENNSYEGLIIHPSCPFDYCVRSPVSIRLDDLDIQCNNNHSGILCGSCNDDYSIAFGTLHCHPCSNDYLALIIPFALAGILLVAFLLLLKFSVAIGTINGLIFYANVVQVNRYIFFPPETTNILTVFIAWLNLDLGIETCFFDGMNTYAFAWLQFLFPFYVWFLIGLIIVLSHYFDVIAKALGKNPVAALATLFLLSYSKILRTIIMALSFTRLDYPDGITRVVWLYDGNIPYFQQSNHIILGVFALTVLFVLFLPYTFLLLCDHWLLHYSDKPVFSWLNKLKPFMDAYYAPYKKETRYWTGVTLLVRCILFLVFAFNALGNASVNLLAITSVMAGLAALAWMHNRLYEHLYNDILEASFILNLCIFSAATYHVKETGGSQAGLAYTSVGIAFATFVYIILFHVYLRIHKTAMWKKIPKPTRIRFGRMGEDEVEGEGGEVMPIQDNEVVQPPTTTVIELREPMLEKY